MRNFLSRHPILFLFCSLAAVVWLPSWPELANAQDAIDPSSALLLSSPTAPRLTDRSQREQAVESGRYTVRPKSSTIITPVQTQRRTESLGGNPPSAAANASAPVVVAPNSNGTVVLRDRTGENGMVGPSSPSLDAKADGGAAGQGFAGSPLLRLSIASAYYSETSTSNYSFRNYGISGPAYVAEARIWLSGEFGIGASYFSSLAGQVSDGVAEVAVGRTDLVWGALFRQTFEESSLILAVEAVESQFNVSSEATSRLKTKSAGFRLRVEGDFGAWVGAFSLAPKLSHEESATAATFQSGSAVESYAAGLFVERRWSFDPTSQMFVRLGHSVERNLFTGAATRIDPTSGQTPSGVGVTVGTTLIQFGYHWSN